MLEHFKFYDIPLGEGHLRRHCDLAFAPFNAHHATPKVSSLAVHLDAFLQELLLFGGASENVSTLCEGKEQTSLTRIT